MKITVAWSVLIRTGMLLFGLNSSFTYARLDEGAIVKTYSHPCHSELSRYKGSGIIFRHRDVEYVLTSEHVVLHGNEGICHRVENSLLGTLDAELVQADWGMGLALLKLKKRVSAVVADLSFITPGNLDNARVMSLGFPFELQTQVRDDRGTILLEKSLRSLIPLVPEMTEVTSAHVEYGMSGGAVFTVDAGDFVGIISHLKLRPVKERPSEVVEISATEPIADHFFVIPASVVYPWVSGVIAQISPKPPTFVRDGESVLSDGLRFTASNSRQSSPAGGTIGGADGTGVGGADGTGAGGAEQSGDSLLATSGCANGISMRIELDHSGKKTRWAIEHKREWIERVRSRLLRRQSVCVPFFVQYGKQKDQAKRVYFDSLAKFFTLLREKYELLPATLMSADSSSVDAKFSALQTKSKSIEKTLSALLTAIEKRPSMDAQRLLSQLKLLCEFIGTGDWSLIDLQWVRGLRCSQYEVSWQVLFNADFENSVALMGTLLEIVELLEKFLL